MTPHWGMFVADFKDFSRDFHFDELTLVGWVLLFPWHLCCLGIILMVTGFTALGRLCYAPRSWQIKNYWYNRVCTLSFEETKKYYTPEELQYEVDSHGGSPVEDHWLKWDLADKLMTGEKKWGAHERVLRSGSIRGW
jgi:hypothetical protein